jgi:DNA (cytosine-5)-methyltransferase 1
MNMIRIGSLFAGIGGFELGLERAIPQSKTIWQIEQNLFCQSILKKHWKDAVIFDDVCTVGKHNLPEVDLLCGGFPCQDISVAGKREGINEGKKSSLWWQMHRIISELRPRVVVLENVANVIRLGGLDVIASLAEIGYDCEWQIIRASDFGAPHRRARWFCVAYSDGIRSSKTSDRRSTSTFMQGDEIQQRRSQEQNTAYSGCIHSKKQSRHPVTMETDRLFECGGSKNSWLQSYNWQRTTTESPVCRVDDGIPKRVDRIKSLGNAIVPACSEWIGMQIYKSGLLDDLYK